MILHNLRMPQHYVIVLETKTFPENFIWNVCFSFQIVFHPDLKAGYCAGN